MSLYIRNPDNFIQKINNLNKKFNDLKINYFAIYLSDDNEIKNLTKNLEKNKTTDVLSFSMTKRIKIKIKN